MSTKLTFDTNSFINIFDATSLTATSLPELKILMQYGLSGKAEISITTRVEDDLMRDRDFARLLHMLQLLSVLPVIGAEFRLDHSKLDSKDYLTKADGLSLEVQRVLFPGLSTSDRRYINKRNDVDHLVSHFRAGRDIFVTDDSHITRHSDELTRTFGIVAKSPRDSVTHIDAMFQRARVPSPTTGLVRGTYHSKPNRGSASFNYSNNNGMFSIGEGFFLFETKWTKASDTCIYVVNSGDRMNGIAVAKQVSSIAEIKDASAVDYSSSHRCPVLGQIVVWRNIAGLYAATHITAIHDDTRGAIDDEVAFDYIIMDKGGLDFSA